MSSIREYINTLNKIQHDWTAYRERIALDAGLYATDLVVERVGEQRKNHLGDSFGQYSKKDILVGSSSFRTKGAASRAFKEITEFRTVGTTKGPKVLGVLKGGYHRIRELENLGSEDDINFRRSNLMMNSVTPFIESSDSNKIIIAIEPNLQDRKKVMQYLTERFGPIIRLSDQEVLEMQGVYGEAFEEFLNNYFQ